MFEYTGNEITAYYFNKVVFNKYLTDKERNLINALDYFRYDTLKTEKRDFPHISWTTTPAEDFECTELHNRFWLMLMDCKEHAYKLYAEEFKDAPEKVIEDLRESLKGISPTAFCEEIIAYVSSDVKGNCPYKDKTRAGDFSFIERDLCYLCQAMFSALEIGKQTEYTKKARSMVKRKATTIGKFAIKAGLV